MDTEYWNDVAGPKWVRDQVVLDQMLADHASSVLEIAQIKAGQSVIDVGCGCGDLTLQAAALAGKATGVDVSKPMLEHARGRAATVKSSAQFVCADAQTHQPDAAADHLLSRFGVMFFPDPPAAFANMRKWLVPGGRLSFVCWQSMADNPWLSEPARLVAQIIGDGEPPPAGPGPFSLADPVSLYSLLSQASFGEVHVQELRLPITLNGTVEQAVSFFMDRGPVLQAMQRTVRRDQIREAITRFASENHNGTGFSMESAAWLVNAKA